MPRLDGTGPEGKGRQGGRGLGRCKEQELQSGAQLGQGMGLRRRAGGGGAGHRYRSGMNTQNPTGDERPLRECR